MIIEKFNLFTKKPFYKVKRSGSPPIGSWIIAGDVSSRYGYEPLHFLNKNIEDEEWNWNKIHTIIENNIGQVVRKSS